MTDPMTPDHPRWEEFCDRLAGPEGCDFGGEWPDDPNPWTRDGNGEWVMRWKCNGDRAMSARILHTMGLTVDEVEASLLYFATHGGGCDCQVWFHVENATTFEGLGG